MTITPAQKQKRAAERRLARADYYDKIAKVVEAQCVNRGNVVDLRFRKHVRDFRAAATRVRATS